ncbi:MAG TPA: PLP-dependent aspartate aminotransferase family protein [Bacteroidales bacterium]|jgi:methionine-gamma-lyase|nr:PLP-dependent aspartate aminotransferase family protein [Bacteroidales bacterium]HPE39991.1 PLP-dependent aspartate aminotransferase family protein [Bacteroidales bacterium]
MDHLHSEFDTLLVHGGEIKEGFRAAAAPIYLSSTFAFESAEHGAKCFAGESDGYIYTRIGNPTIDALEKQIAALEKGYRGIAVSSGMAAVNVIYQGILGSGDHIVSTEAVYGPSRAILENHYPKYGVESTFVDTTDLKAVEAAFKPNTKLLYIETPANPTMDIADIQACADIAHKHGALLAVDNTFCSPYSQQPLTMGADIVMHSMTKSINGHADIVAGMVVAKDPSIYKILRGMMVNLGCNMDPHQAYMVLRGVKTLSIRIDRATENAQKVAEFLENHPKVAWIKYPGLKSHPQYDLGVKQMKGPGSMISFGLTGGFEAGKKLMDNVHLAMLAVSLGGVETLIQHPASMTHSKVTKEGKLKAGITDDLIRFSVGIESVNDIINDLKKGLELV